MVLIIPVPGYCLSLTFRVCVSNGSLAAVFDCGVHFVNSPCSILRLFSADNFNVKFSDEKV